MKFKCNSHYIVHEQLAYIYFKELIKILIAASKDAAGYSSMTKIRKKLIVQTEMQKTRKLVNYNLEAYHRNNLRENIITIINSIRQYNQILRSTKNKHHAQFKRTCKMYKNQYWL